MNRITRISIAAMAMAMTTAAVAQLPGQQAFPPSGATDWLVPIDASAPFGRLTMVDASGIPTDKVVRIHDSKSSQIIAQVYVHAGEGATVTLPNGTYVLTVASGPAWFGPDLMFGPQGTYALMDGIVPIGSGETVRRLTGAGVGGAPISMDRF